jgi:maltose O-acetyltransferase
MKNTTFNLFKSGKAVIASIGHFVCNHLVAAIPSRGLRGVFYRMWLGAVGTHTGIQLGCRFLNGPKVFIGNNCVINWGTVIDGRHYPVHIGDSVSIGPAATILTLSHDPQSLSFAVKGGSVTIGDHAWIAAHVLVLPNVCIGRGAVAAAGSVVASDVPDFAIVAGVPAKQIGQRTSEIEYVLDYRPWLQ